LIDDHDAGSALAILFSEAAPSTILIPIVRDSGADVICVEGHLLVG